MTVNESHISSACTPNSPRRRHTYEHQTTSPSRSPRTSRSSDLLHGRSSFSGLYSSSGHFSSPRRPRRFDVAGAQIHLSTPSVSPRPFGEDYIDASRSCSGPETLASNQTLLPAPSPPSSTPSSCRSRTLEPKASRTVPRTALCSFTLASFR